MSRFDGSPLPLGYGEALAEIAARVSWPSEAHGADVVKAILVEHGLYVVPEAETRAAEIERLRALKATKDATVQEAAEEAELAALRAELGLRHAEATDPAEVDALAGA